jgi:polysaccharide export outer membrane protein
MKTSVRIFHLLFAALLCCFAAGCYNRLTSNFSELKELSSDDSAMIEASTFLETERKATLRNMVNQTRNNKQAYTINAGDILAISVYNNPDLSVGRTIVTTDGCIGMVLVGQLKVAGMTLDQASAAIEKKLSLYIRNPKVGISLQEIKSETATISGAINKPGMYTISQGMRLADLVALAGGVASRLYDGQHLDAADFSKSVFVREGKLLPVDFYKAIEHGDPDDNVPLRKGDYIHIAARDNSMVYLLGDVKGAQRRVLMPNMGLLELVSSCGGINETHWQYAIIIRGGVNRPKLYKVDIDGVLQGRKPNILLESGDIVYIPHDNITEYNVFIRKLFPTVQLINMISTPMFWYTRF